MDYLFNEYNDQLLNQLPKGAFLTTRIGDKVNTMTIGWGNISVVWYKHVFMVYVRYSRETYNMLEQAGEFTVSFPITLDMKKELAYCGSHSFRNKDKIKDLGLTLINGKNINTPIIAECNLHLECKVIYKQSVEPGMISEEIKDKYYKGNNDYHVCYYGEIVAKYGNIE
ncbi:flavin reductase family protein [Mycoplasmatota bacterium]|nr:flavin reductase family protein [Mycoplasmatota bacterium]